MWLCFLFMWCGCVVLCKRCWAMVFWDTQSSFPLLGIWPSFRTEAFCRDLQSEHCAEFSKNLHDSTNLSHECNPFCICIIILSVSVSACTGVTVPIVTSWSTPQPVVYYFSPTALPRSILFFSYKVHTNPWACVINHSCFCLFAVISYLWLISNLVYYLPCDCHTVSPTSTWPPSSYKHTCKAAGV